MFTLAHDTRLILKCRIVDAVIFYCKNDVSVLHSSTIAQREKGDDQKSSAR